MLSRGGRKLTLLAPVALAVFAVLASTPRAPQAAEPALGMAVAAVESHPVPLDPSNAGRERIGALVYRGGLRLESPDPRFGGLSDIRIVAGGTRLVAVSDCGTGLTAALSYDAEGWLAGVSDLRLIDIPGLQGEPLQMPWRDAESLVETGDSLEVGFEGIGRVWAYAEEPPFGGPARKRPVPAGLAFCGRNGGLETMTRLDERRRLLICEGRRSASLDVAAWIGSGAGWTTRSYPLAFAGGWMGEPFRPTAATLLPGGDVLVLERRFPPFGARVARLSAADLLGTGALHPREIARLEYPLTIDNFEGIDARSDEAGRTYVYLVTDDNACVKLGGKRPPAVERTLLLMFELAG